MEKIVAGIFIGFFLSWIVTSSTSEHLEVNGVHLHHYVWSFPLSLLLLYFGQEFLAGIAIGITIEDFIYPQTWNDLEQGIL